MIEIKPRSATAFVLKKGSILEVVDPFGQQVSDMLAYNLDDPTEVLSNDRTFDYEETIKLSVGNIIWSNKSNKMLEIMKDDVGSHDFLLTPCSEATFRHFYKDKPIHRGCFGNLSEALQPYGIKEDSIVTAFNIFMNVPVDSISGKISVLPPNSKAGDSIQFKAEMNLIIGLTACSAYDSNGGIFKPIQYRIL